MVLISLGGTAQQIFFECLRYTARYLPKSFEQTVYNCLDACGVPPDMPYGTSGSISNIFLWIVEAQYSILESAV